MGFTTAILTFAAGAQQFPAPADLPTVRRIVAEPLRSNTHGCFVGGSTVTNDGSGTGVITELAQPPAATLPLDRFEYVDQTGSNRIDPTVFWAHGTAGEKIKVTYFKI